MRALFPVLFLAFCLGAAPAAADRFTLSYDGSGLGFIPLGQISVDIDISDRDYVVSAAIRSGGLLDLFERTNLRAGAEGVIADGAVRWRRYDLDHYYSRKHRVIAMHAGEDGAVIAEINPNYRLWGDPPASDEQRRRSRDPLSSLVAMAIDVGQTRRCAGAYPTFDGRFHYLLELAGGQIERYRGGGYRGEVLKCSLAYYAVAGFEPSDRGRRRVPRGQIWFALAPHSNFAPPVRVSTPLNLGAALVRLHSWRRVVVDIDPQ